MLYPSFISMVSDHKTYTQKLAIHKDFPRDKLINIMRPYLYLYYVSKYAIQGTEEKYVSRYKLIEKIKKFVSFNPQFGRMYIKNAYSPNFSKLKPIITFNDKHIQFYTTDVRVSIDFNAFYLLDEQTESDDQDEPEYDEDVNDEQDEENDT